jgi:small-conductance mechanosensitive channel
MPILISMQVIPTAPDTVHVPIPAALERWRDLYVADVGMKLLVFMAVGVFLWLLARVARRMLGEHIEDVNRRHAVRKGIGYGLSALLLLFGVALFADSVAGFGTVLGLILAGVAVALQDVLKSVVGWLYISARSGVEVGSRVEVGGVVGDVIDIGVLKTTVLEVGNLVFGRQSTGRVVTIPNFQMVSASVSISGIYNPFVWQEVRVTVPFESDWQKAEDLLRSAGEDLHREIAPELDSAFRRLEKRFAFKYGALTPIVYVTLGTYGVELTLRFLTPVRRRRGSEDRVSRAVLKAFPDAANVRFAYPTYRAVHLENGRPEEEEVSPGRPFSRRPEDDLAPPDLMGH